MLFLLSKTKRLEISFSIKFDIDVAGKAIKLSNLTSLLSFLQAHYPYIALENVLGLLSLLPMCASEQGNVISLVSQGFPQCAVEWRSQLQLHKKYIF